MKKYLGLVFLVLCFLSSCKREHDARVFKFNWNITFPREIKLSKVASGLEYIVLENSDSCILPEIFNTYISGDRILIVPTTKKEFPFLFNRKGNFVRQIDIPGFINGETRCPVMDVRFDSLAGTISLYSHDNIYCFDWDGNYVSRKEIRDTSWSGADVHNFCLQPFSFSRDSSKASTPWVPP